MRNLDAVAINDFGVPSLELMENAGRLTVEAMVDCYGDLGGRTVSILVGPGNNGGDGLVMARRLCRLGALVELFFLVAPERISGDAAINLALLQGLPISQHFLMEVADLEKAAAIFNKSWAVVDALFGTGLTRPLSGHIAETVKLINRFPGPVISVDMPSGLDADCGQPLGVCVQADMTVTFGLAKVGQHLSPGRKLSGSLKVVDIGIPETAISQSGISLEILTPQEIEQWLPPRKATAHKGTMGHLLLVAGSTGKTGAAILSALGGLYSGTGLVSMAIPVDLNSIFEIALWEAMTVPMVNSASGFLSNQDYDSIFQALLSRQAVVLGPGLGMHGETADLVTKLYREVPLPMVVDADGLNLLALKKIDLKDTAARRILTPHPGEMARLTGLSVKDIQKDRQAIAGDFAGRSEQFVILKGAGTIIAAPDGRIKLNTTGNPGMAAGGMGDVLAGLTGGFLAQGLSPWRAACLGAYLHGLAGDLVAAGQPVYLASELAKAIPAAIQKATCNQHRQGKGL